MPFSKKQEGVECASHCSTGAHEDVLQLGVAAQVLLRMDHLPTEADLIKQLLHVEAEQRPSLDAVLQHPCLWNDMQRLDLLVGLSNYLESMGKVSYAARWSGFCACVWVMPRCKH